MSFFRLGRRPFYKNKEVAASTFSNQLPTVETVQQDTLVIKARTKFDNTGDELVIITRDGKKKATDTVTITENTQNLIITQSDALFGTDVIINPGVYVWSDSTSIPALTAAVPVTITNYGYIIGKGGNGGNSSGTLPTAGGLAVSITASGVTIQNNSGGYIAGGGGGGGYGYRSGGGGGAGGGAGGTSTWNSRYAGPTYSGAGGGLGASGSSGSGSTGSVTAAVNTGNGGAHGTGGGAGGGGGGGHDKGSIWAGGAGGGGGRIPSGSGGVSGRIWRDNGTLVYGYAGNGGSGGSAGGSGTNIFSDVSHAGGGGGWGAAGGSGVSGSGGAAGGRAITASTGYTLVNSGTIYGAT